MHFLPKGIIRGSKLKRMDFFATFQTHYTLAIPMICIVNILEPQSEINGHFKVRYLVLSKYLDY